MSRLAEAFLNKWASNPEAENQNRQIRWGIHQKVSFGEKLEIPKWGYELKHSLLFECQEKTVQSQTEQIRWGRHQKVSFGEKLEFQ